MSRIGKSPIVIPEGTTVDIKDNIVTVKGKLGELSQEFSEIAIKIEDGVITLERPSESKNHKAKHGLYRSLLYNMVVGVSKAWTKELELVGVGYRASNQGQDLELALG
ncbi:MAG TPA: 50S ribosomal protein L6, partial [Flavobacteriia bacterium]|nr:50S ribosomal protein L6 [Flavobacteriia bacterium]